VLKIKGVTGAKSVSADSRGLRVEKWKAEKKPAAEA
jgi:hypothetical protein